MATEDLKSTSITNADATPVVFNNSFVAGSDLKEKVATVEVTSGVTTGSTYRMVRVPSSARISALKLYGDAITTAFTPDIGIYKTAADGGAVVDADLFAAALVTTSALNNSDVTYETTATNISKIEKRLWELAGLTVDPGIDYDIALTSTATAGSAGTMSLKVQYVI